jgi:hypothetical protein
MIPQTKSMVEKVFPSRKVIPNANGTVRGATAIKRAGTLANGDGKGDQPMACIQRQIAANSEAGQKTGSGNPAGTKIRHAGSIHRSAKVAAANSMGQPTKSHVESGSVLMCVGKPELFTPKSAGPYENALSNGSVAINTITIDIAQQ